MPTEARALVRAFVAAVDGGDAAAARRMLDPAFADQVLAGLAPARRLTLLTVPTGLITAGVLLSRYPWRSVDGYIGQSPWVQLPALIALGVLSASLLAFWRADQTDTATTASP